MSYFLAAVGWVAIASAAAYALMAIDKARARRGAWRVAEATLLTAAAVGGTPGTLLAQRRLRHKTRKQPFRAILIAIGLLQLGTLFVAGRLLLA